MKEATMGRWRAIAAVFALALTACGGGGGSPATADARNGSYEMFVADGNEYTLNLDFDADTYHLTNSTTDSTGTFTANNGGFDFQAAGAAPAANSAHFAQFNDAASGGFRFASGVLPFVAARSFVNTVADAEGTYKFLTSTVDSANGNNNAIFTGRIASDGNFYYCNDAAITTIENCSTIVQASLSVSGSDFTATIPNAGSFKFRIAKIGADKLFLRASASSATARRFWVGIDQDSAWADMRAVGVNNDGLAVASTLTGGSLDTQLTSEAGAITSRMGAWTALVLPGMALYDASADGSFFAMGNTGLTFVFAGRNNPAHPGYIEIDRH